jgi:hypothetical protein
VWRETVKVRVFAFSKTIRTTIKPFGSSDSSHVLRKFWTILEKKLMVVRVAVQARGNTKKSVQLELPKKTRPLSLSTKVLSHDVLNEDILLVYAKGATMRHERYDLSIEPLSLHFYQHAVKPIGKEIIRSTNYALHAWSLRLRKSSRIDKRIRFAAKSGTQDLQDAVCLQWRGAASSQVQRAPFRWKPFINTG